MFQGWFNWANIRMGLPTNPSKHGGPESDTLQLDYMNYKTAAL